MGSLISGIFSFFEQIGSLISVVVNMVVYAFTSMLSALKFIVSGISAIPAVLAIVPPEIYPFVFLGFQLVIIGVIIKIVRG